MHLRCGDSSVLLNLQSETRGKARDMSDGCSLLLQHLSKDRKRSFPCGDLSDQTPSNSESEKS